MKRKAMILGVSAATLLLAAAGCGGGGGGSSGGGRGALGPAQTMEEVIVTGGTVNVAPDATTVDPTTSADRTRLGIAAIGRSFSLTTPRAEPLDLAFTGSAPGARGAVTVRLAVAGGGSGSAAGDLAQTGLLARAGNLIDTGAWLETVGDGFARITLSGSVTVDTTLVVEREASGVKRAVAVVLRIGARGPANPSFPATTAFAGVRKTVDLFSSDSPIFGLPAIAGSGGDRLSVICYDSVFSSNPGPQPGAPVAGCVAPGIERRQKRLQYDDTTGAKTQGETVDLGNDSSYWRDTEVAGLFNVLAIAQAGGAGVSVSISFDRGATFPATFTLGTADFTRLVAIDMANDYTTGVLFWSTTQTGTELVLVEGAPSSFDANRSPDAFAFGARTVLLSKGQNLTPLVSDVQYSACGDLFVATGFTEFIQLPDLRREMRMTVASFRRHAGTTDIIGPTTVDVETDIVPSDPSIAVIGCGASAQVFVAYESRDGARVRKSSDGGASYGPSTAIGTSSAHAPRVFARPGPLGTTVVDCLYLDLGPAGLGDDLNLLRIQGDLVTAKSVHALVQARLVSGTGGNQDVESVGWFGFDACDFDGDLWVAVHTQLQGAYVPFGGGRRGGVFTGAAGMAAGAPAAPPAVLLPGMTQPVPPFAASATNKLRLLQVD